MTKLNRMLSAAAIAGGLTLSMAAVASAQQDTSPPGPPATAGQRHWDPAQMRARFEEHRQHRQQVLHDALGLRADQEGAWQTFVASSRPPEGQRGPGMRRHEDGEKAELSTPQRLDRMQQRMSEHQARFAQRAEAVKRFYGSLDTRQQKTFDALQAARGGGMDGWGHRGHMGGGGPMRG